MGDVMGDVGSKSWGTLVLKRFDDKEPTAREGQASVGSMLAAVPAATLASISACVCCPGRVPYTLMKGGYEF